MAAGVKTGGRTKGTPNKATADIREAAQEYTTEALETLAEVMRSKDSAAARVAAASALLDRAHGKPKQSMDVDANVIATVQRIELVGVRPNGDSPA